MTLDFEDFPYVAQDFHLVISLPSELHLCYHLFIGQVLAIYLDLEFNYIILQNIEVLIAFKVDDSRHLKVVICLLLVFGDGSFHFGLLTTLFIC